MLRQYFPGGKNATLPATNMAPDTGSLEEEISRYPRKCYVSGRKGGPSTPNPQVLQQERRLGVGHHKKLQELRPRPCGWLGRCVRKNRVAAAKKHKKKAKQLSLSLYPFLRELARRCRRKGLEILGKSAYVQTSDQQLVQVFHEKKGLSFFSAGWPWLSNLKQPQITTIAI